MHILEIINSIESSGTQPFRLSGGPTDKTEVDFSYFEESSKILWLENFKLYLFKQFRRTELLSKINSKKKFWQKEMVYD